MDDKKVIETVGEILMNDLIHKEGLSLTYKLDEEVHKKLDLEFYNKMVGHKDGFEYSEEFEVEINGMIIKFVKDEKE